LSRFKLIISLCFALLILSCHTKISLANHFGGVHTTPTNYVVNISRIEFRNSQGTFITFAQGAFPFDLAQVNPNQISGAINAGGSLPPETYDRIRFTFSRSFGVTGSLADAGGDQPARTNTGNASTGTLDGGNLTAVGVASTDGGAATQQSVPIPTGDDVTDALTAAGMVESGANLQVTHVVNFTITQANSVLPTIRMDYDVTNTLEFLTTGPGTAAVAPIPPSVTLTIN